MRLPPFPLVDWFAAAEGRFDYSLSHTDCEPLSLSDLFDEAELPGLAGFRLGYGSFAGLDELRANVAGQYTTIGKDDVLIFGGASEAIYTFMRTTLNPGDEVVVQSPLFQTLHAIARSMGCHVTEWRPRDELTCSFDVSDLPDRRRGLTIDRRFIAGVGAVTIGGVPKGRRRPWDAAVPFGTRFLLVHAPAIRRRASFKCPSGTRTHAGRQPAGPMPTPTPKDRLKHHD